MKDLKRDINYLIDKYEMEQKLEEKKNDNLDFILPLLVLALLPKPYEPIEIIPTVDFSKEKKGDK